MIRAFYSEEQRQLTGTMVWLGADGAEIECTCVGANPPLFADAQDLGEVVKFARPGHPTDKWRYT